MARNVNRLPTSSVAPLIQEAVQRLNPDNGLTQDELVAYVFSNLGFEEGSIQERVDEFLSAGTNNGALVRTNNDKYQVVEPDGRKLKAALDACCTPCRPRCRRRPRCCRPRCCIQRCNVRNHRYRRCRRRQDCAPCRFRLRCDDDGCEDPYCSQGPEY